MTYTAMLGVVVVLGVPAMQYLPWPGSGVAPSNATPPAEVPELDLSLPSTDSVLPAGHAGSTVSPPAAPVTPSPAPKPDKAVQKPASPPSAAKTRAAAALLAKKTAKAEPAPVAAVPVQTTFALSKAELAPTPAAEPADAPDDTATRGPFYDVRQVDVRPQVESQVPPTVPEHLRGRSVKDVVVLRVRVSPAGRAADVQVLRRSSVDAALDSAAVAAVKKWRFSPARRRGQAVNCWFSVGVPIAGDAEAKGGH